MLYNHQVLSYKFRNNLYLTIYKCSNSIMLHNWIKHCALFSYKAILAGWGIIPYIVTDLKFGLWKTWWGSCVVEANSWWGCQCRHRWIPAIPLHMHSAFPTEMGGQTILTSFGDVIIALLMHLWIGYKRKPCKSLGTVVWVSGSEWLGQMLGGHWPSTLAISVPLMEQEYIPVELCALFIHLPMPRLVWDTLS